MVINQKIKANVPSLFLMILLVGFPQISETIYTPSLPDIAKTLSTSDELVQFTLSIYFTGFAVGVSLWGILADRYGRRPALIGGIVLYTLASLGCFLSYSIESILFFRFFQAFGASTGSIVGMTLIRDIYTGTDRSKAFSSIGAALSLSPAFGPMIGGAVDQFFGWRANFLVLVMMGIVLILSTGLRLRETRPSSIQVLSTREFFDLALRLCTDKKVLRCALLIGACNGLIFSYYSEAPFVFINMLGLSAGQYGLLGLVVAGATLTASALSHRLNSHLPAEKIIGLGVAVVLLGVGFLSVLSHIEFEGGSMISSTHTQFASVIRIVASIGVIFVGIGMIIPNTISIALINDQSAIGTAGSIFGLIYYLLISGFTALMGLLHDGTIHAMLNSFLFLEVLMLPSGISGFFIRRTSLKVENFRS